MDVKRCRLEFSASSMRSMRSWIACMVRSNSRSTEFSGSRVMKKVLNMVSISQMTGAACEIHSALFVDVNLVLTLIMAKKAFQDLLAFEFHLTGLKTAGVEAGAVRHARRASVSSASQGRKPLDLTPYHPRALWILWVSGTGSKTSACLLS
jgi:hypothetical protein